jgi:predicted dienelactone hydrolase
VAAQDSLPPLAERGPYHVGGTRLAFSDPARDGRNVGAVIWYPGVVPPDRADQIARAETSQSPLANIAPDPSGGPYPVVFYSPDYGGLPTDFRAVLEPLASHGFVVVGMDHQNMRSAVTYLDRPLDVLLVLDELAALNEDPASDWYGLLNTDQAGVVGFGSGAVTTTALSGARIDPEAARGWVEWIGPLITYLFSDWNWDTFANYHDRVGMTEADGLWNAVTDPRIRAVISYMPCATGLFGARGMAEATVPTLMIGGTLDAVCDYELETVVDRERMAGADVELLSLIGAGHQQPYGVGAHSPDHILPFVRAFFGTHLQGQPEYAAYLSEDFARTLDGVAWGVADIPMLAPEHIPNFTFSDGGALTLGEPVTGDVPTATDRVGFSLTLPADSLLDLTASGTGRSTSSTIYAKFDPVLYLLNDQGEVMAWNDELDLADNGSGIFDAGFRNFELPAGDYTLVVGGFRMAGPFALLAEATAP